MMRLVVPLIVVVTLAACASRPSAVPIEGTVDSGPAATAGLDWFLTEDATETKLAYGRANSDDFRFALSCAPGSGQFGLIQPAAAGETMMVLESGGDTERFPALSEPAGMQEGDVLVANSPSQGPVFQRFRRLGWLATWQGQTREVLVAHPETRSSVDRFFAICG